MTPLLRAGVLAALLSALAVLVSHPTAKVRVGAPASSAPRTAAGPVAPCPRGTLPDANVCVPVPKETPDAAPSGRDLPR